jgi:glycosyltransferase involved in cell wall biosynthesis
MKMDRLVSVVVPIRNDEDIIGSFLDETVQVLRDHYTHFEVILVDDGSPESSQPQLLKQLSRHEGVRLIQLSRRFGEEVAISAGLESAIGDYVVVALASSDPPAMIPELVQKCLEGHDIAYGVRSRPVQSGLLYRALSSAFYAYCSRFLDLEIPANATQFKCFSRRAVNALLRIDDPSRYLRVFSSVVGFKRVAVPYDTVQRGDERKGRNVISSIGVAIGVVFENSAHPLRVVTWLGILAALANIVYIFYILLVYLFKEDVMPGWTTISFQMAAQFCFITAILAALAEYIGRIMSRLQDRPKYFVMDEHEGTMNLPGQKGWNVVDAAVTSAPRQAVDQVDLALEKERD